MSNNSKPEIVVHNPENKEHHVVFKGAPWYDKTERVVIGGAGGIGSPLAFMLIRAGFPVTQFDHDTIELRNIGGQLYSPHQVGSHKVSAMNDFISMMTKDAEYTPLTMKIEKPEDIKPTPIMVAAFDNMEARRILFDSWRSGPNPKLFIDPRLLAEEYVIYCVTPENADSYLQDGYFEENDEDNEIQNCTYKQTTHIACRLGADITSLITNFICDKPLYCPYNISYYAPYGKTRVTNKPQNVNKESSKE